MKKPCKRGNIAQRDKYGHCLCDECKAYNYSVARASEKKRAYVKKWRVENKDKVASYTAKWNRNNKAQRKYIVASWRRRNPDKVKAMSNKAGKKWNMNNKGKRNAIVAKRKYSLIARTPPWADIKKIKAVYIEASRITKETGIPHEVDHIIPLQGEFVSGLHVHTNLQILTREQNRSKGNRYENFGGLRRVPGSL